MSIAGVPSKSSCPGPHWPIEPAKSKFVRVDSHRSKS